jgi:uroporphyrinogen decarboxylase
MAEWTTKKRMEAMFSHREADRIPVTDTFWTATIARWHREGMPKDVSIQDYFGLDKIATIGVDISPRFPESVTEETEEYIIRTTRWGATQKEWKKASSTPAFLDFKVKCYEDWLKAKELMQKGDDRINWRFLKEHYPRWRKEGYWIQAGFWFGFDVTHSWFVGTERLLIAMVEQPEWCMDMFNTFLELNLKYFDEIWNAGYEFDCIRWPDDMGFKHSQFFSVDTYRELLKPVHAKAVEWAHKKGIKPLLHSCGNIKPLIPEFLDFGLDGLNPLEVKAGMDPIWMKKTYGDKLLLHGGIDILLWEDAEKVKEEMKRVVPVMMENGGYVFSSDHSVPSSISLDEYKEIVEPAKKIGRFG